MNKYFFEKYKKFNINDPNRDADYNNTLFMEQQLEPGKEYTEDNLINIYEEWRNPLGHVSARMYKLFVQNIISKWNLF